MNRNQKELMESSMSLEILLFQTVTKQLELKYGTLQEQSNFWASQQLITDLQLVLF